MLTALVTLLATSALAQSNEIIAYEDADYLEEGQWEWVDMPALESIEIGDDIVTEVVGGNKTSDDRWDDAVLVVMRNSLCTGTLIAPKVVLTAAHCNSGIQGVIVGTNNYNSQQGSYINVEQTWSSPQYQGWGADIAVIKLASAARNYTPRIIATDCIVDDYLKDGADVAIVGFGAKNVAGTSSDSYKREGFSQVLDADCSRDRVNGIATYCDPSQRSKNGEIAAGGNGVDACFGDSGGPLYLLTERGDYVAGVTSRAFGGVPNNEPCGHGGIWTRPDAFIDWMENKTGTTFDRPQCNFAPEAFADDIVTKSGDSGSTVVEVTDADGESFTIDIAVDPEHGSVSIGEGGEVTYTADSDFVGEDSFILAITDDGSAYAASPPITVELEVFATVEEGGGLFGSGGGGCGCNSSAPAGSLGLFVLGLVGLLRRRR